MSLAASVAGGARLFRPTARRPVRAAAAIITAVNAARPPLRLLLGSEAYRLVLSRLDTLREGFEAWKDLTVSADFLKA